MPEYDVVVVGSANADTVLTVSAFPSPGETITARSSRQSAGGKGLNQAVAAARAGARVAFRGRIGDDAAGEVVRAALVGADVDTAGLLPTIDPTGSAHILVDATGENCITLTPGANATYVTLTDDDRNTIASSRVLFLQGEIPDSSLTEAAHVARSSGVAVVFTPAPARRYPEDLLDMVDVLVPNEHEARVLTSQDDMQEAARLLTTNTRAVLVTLGGRGSLLSWHGGQTHVPPIRTTVVDTIGAGDTFVGALGSRLAGGADLEAATIWATAAGSLAVARAAGAPSPAAAEIEAFLAACHR